MKKFILLIFTFLLFAGCAMDSLDVVNGSKFYVKSKTQDEQTYWYRLIEVGGDSWYDYYYSDTTNFDVGDTLILNIKKVSNNYNNN